MGIEKLEYVYPGTLSTGQCMLRCWVRIKNMLEQLTSGRLASFSHPTVREDRVSVRAPDTRDKDRLWRHSDMARRCSSDHSQTGECFNPPTQRRVRVYVWCWLLFHFNLSTNCA